MFWPIAALTSAGPREVEPRSLGHQHRVAEHGQVGPAGHAVAHDRGVLGNALRGEHGVVAEDPAEIVLVGKDLVLHRQEDARGIDEVDQRQPAGRRDRLGAEDLLDREGKAGPGLHRRVVGDDHDPAAVNRADHRHHARRRCPAPLGVHLVAGPEPQLQRAARRGRARARSAREPSSAPSRAAARWPRARPPGEADPPGRGPATSRRASGSSPGSSLRAVLCVVVTRDLAS